MAYPTFAEAKGLVADQPEANIACRDQPSILVAREEYTTLCRLAVSARSGRPLIADFLAAELQRARIVPFSQLPKSVVSMGSTVEYHHDDLDHVRRVTLVYPEQHDIDAKRISVLTSIGTALLGMEEGQSIEFSVRPGSRTRIIVLKVIPPDLFSDRG